MTDTNKEDQKAVDGFEWATFPVEMPKCCVIVCLDKLENIDNDVDKLINYLKIIYPQTITEYKCRNEVCGKFEYNGENTLLIIVKSDYSWLDDLVFMEILNRKKYHLLVIGNYKKIPKILISSSDVIIFENSEETIPYFSSKGIKFSNFDNLNYFPIGYKIDNKFEVKTLNKSLLSKYDSIPIINDGVP